MNGIQDSLPGRMKISGHQENVYTCLKGGHCSLCAAKLLCDSAHPQRIRDHDTFKFQLCAEEIRDDRFIEGGRKVRVR